MRLFVAAWLVICLTVVAAAAAVGGPVVAAPLLIAVGIVYVLIRRTLATTRSGIR